MVLDRQSLPAELKRSRVVFQQNGYKAKRNRTSKSRKIKQSSIEETRIIIMLPYYGVTSAKVGWLVGKLVSHSCNKIRQLLRLRGVKDDLGLCV